MTTPALPTRLPALVLALLGLVAAFLTAPLLPASAADVPDGCVDAPVGVYGTPSGTAATLTGEATTLCWSVPADRLASLVLVSVVPGDGTPDPTAGASVTVTPSRGDECTWQQGADADPLRYCDLDETPQPGDRIEVRVTPDDATQPTWTVAVRPHAGDEHCLAGEVDGSATAAAVTSIHDVECVRFDPGDQEGFRRGSFVADGDLAVAWAGTTDWGQPLACFSEACNPDIDWGSTAVVAASSISGAPKAGEVATGEVAMLDGIVGRDAGPACRAVDLTQGKVRVKGVLDDEHPIACYAVVISVDDGNLRLAWDADEAPVFAAAKTGSSSWVYRTGLTAAASFPYYFLTTYSTGNRPVGSGAVVLTRPAGTAELPFTLTLRCPTADGSCGQANQVFNLPALGVPAPTGDAAVDGRLAAPDLAERWRFQPATVLYRWLRDGTAVRGATEASYRPVAADRGHDLTVEITGADPYLRDLTVVSRPVRVRVGDAPVVVRDPVVRGKARVGRVLRVATGTWRPAPSSFSVRWYVGPGKKADATGRRLILRPRHVGQRVRVKIVARIPGHRSGSSVVRVRGAVRR
ncbi:hypothetical protein [Nocardioides bruguierae]|uniref:Ig-like domain-containing protein n=1 Tax=Nocardioides bruguierae TaxID=2945102 RepID=A0A9X2IEK4_9ACTN|nr:hypothetical protein [Nocardioides bruguierae]MCM0620392.1 hypothetical protein [Nocardioides bruguierae]